MGQSASGSDGIFSRIFSSTETQGLQELSVVLSDRVEVNLWRHENLQDAQWSFHV